MDTEQKSSIQVPQAKKGLINLSVFGIQNVHLPEQTFMMLKTTFDLFDRDGGGEIDTNELEDVLRSMGMKPTEHQMEEIVNELDQNRDGTIEFHEFLKVMAVPKRGSAALKLMTRVLGNSRMFWSEKHMAYGIKLDRALTTATRTDFWQVGSVRATAPLALQGQTYFQITIKRPGKRDGQALNGFYFIGVCDSDIDIWDGPWWEDGRASSAWALRSEMSNEEHVGLKGGRTHAELCGLGVESRVEWAPGTSFGSGDVIGVYIDLGNPKF